MSVEAARAALEVAKVAGLSGDRAVRYASGVLAVDLKISPSAARALILGLATKRPTSARRGSAPRDIVETTMTETNPEAPAASIPSGETEEATMSKAGKKRAKKAPAKAAVKRDTKTGATRSASAGERKAPGAKRGGRASGPRPGTISALVVELKKAGISHEKIAAACAKKFPKKASVDAAAVSWYAWNAVKKGWLPKGK